MSAREATSRQPRNWSKIATVLAIGLVLVCAGLVAVPLFATDSPEFFSRYHLLERRYVNLEASAHEGIGCRVCHETDPVANGSALVADYYRSILTTDQVPRYFKFQPPKREACLKCHSDDWANKAESIERIPHPAHTRVSAEKRECVTCHKWTAHFEAYMVKHEEMPFSGVCVAYGCHVGTKQPDQCFDCHHVLRDTGKDWETEEHAGVVLASGKNMCLEECHKIDQCQLCHTTGERPEFDGLPIETSMRSIEERHVREDWMEHHGAEAIQNRDNCMKCHQDEGECGECHRERPAFHGDVTGWIGRHKNVTEDLEDPRCIECHEQVFCDDCHRQFQEME